MITVDRLELTNALSIVTRAIGGRSIIPAAQGVLVTLHGDSMSIEGTDIDNRLSTGVFFQSKVGHGPDKTTFLIPAVQLYQFVQRAESPRIDFTFKGDTANVVAGRAKLRLSLLDPTDFPGLPGRTFRDIGTATINQLTRLADHCSFAADGQGARAILDNVIWKRVDGRMYMAGMNQARIASVSVESPADDFIICIPPKALGIIAKVFDGVVNLRLGGSYLDVSSERINGTFRLVGHEDFPPYDRLLAIRGDRRTTVKRAGLASAIGRIEVMTGAELINSKVEMSFDEGRLGLRTVVSDKGEAADEVDASIDGEPFKKGISVRYLSDAVSTIKSEEILITTTANPRDMIMFEPTGDYPVAAQVLVAPMDLTT